MTDEILTDTVDETVEELSDKASNFRKLAASLVESRTETEKWQERALAAEAVLDGQPAGEEADTSGLAELQAKYEATVETAHRGVLIEAGFLPDSGEAKALLRDLEAGLVSPDAASVVTHASAEYNWSPNVVLYSKAETGQMASTAELHQIQSQSVSDEPANIDQQISEAEQAGNHTLARHLKNQVLQAQMMGQK